MDKDKVDKDKVDKDKVDKDKDKVDKKKVDRDKVDRDNVDKDKDGQGQGGVSSSISWTFLELRSSLHNRNLRPENFTLENAWIFNESRLVTKQRKLKAWRSNLHTYLYVK